MSSKQAPLAPFHTWTDYQVWTLTTDTYPRHKIPYSYELGLLSEVGELASIVKKRIRDGVGREVDYIRALGHELGDIAWYTARFAAFHQLQGMVDLHHEHGPGCTVKDIAEVVHNLMVQQSHSSLDRVLIHLAEYTGSLGLSLGEILEWNRSKLLSRLERGTIGGSGDNR